MTALPLSSQESCDNKPFVLFINHTGSGVKLSSTFMLVSADNVPSVFNTEALLHSEQVGSADNSGGFMY